MHGADRNVTIRTNSRSAYPNRRASVADRQRGCANEEHAAADVAPESVSSAIGVTKNIYVRRLVLVLGLLCLTPGCSVFYLAKRTVKYEPREYDITLEEADACEQYAIWAEQAWGEYQGQNPDVATSADYYDGFRNGFVDYCFAGGSGEPPPVPPRRFWRTMYRNAAGDQTIADWSSGFRAGSGAARAGGYRKRAVVPSPSSQHNTLAYQDPSARQTNQPILTAPGETLLDEFDAAELLDAGPELAAPKSGTSKSEAPATKTGPTVVPDSVVPDAERVEDPYLKSPLEDMQREQRKTQRQSNSTEPRKMPSPANKGSLNSVREIEPNRLRYDDFFRLPGNGNVPDGAEGDSATRIDFSSSAQQASNRMTTSSDVNIDAERASWVISEADNKKLRQPPIRIRDRTTRHPGKNATELAKHAQTLFQYSDDIEPVYTTFSKLFTKQP